MTSSLVGSEMCIRDRARSRSGSTMAERIAVREELHLALCDEVQAMDIPVSYTHLTLPTICSV
eukprot:12767695-Prorocentrum_lima.AAC.1